jgi:radical SAM-linked protein
MGREMTELRNPQALTSDVLEQPRQRLRLTYEKGEAIKFISHQDEFRLWERTLRRADLPLLYSQGFTPQPQLQFASPLGVGITGVNEFLDITLSPPVSLAEVEQRTRAKLPPGVVLHAVAEVPLKTEALQGLLIGADYTILIYAEPDEIAPALITKTIEQFLAQQTVWRERERKGEKYIYNLRPLVFELTYIGYAPDREEHQIFLRVQQREGATGRPDEVVAALGFEDYARTLRRDRVYLANQPADLAMFAAYPLIHQDEIAHPANAKHKSRRRRGAPIHHTPHKTGQSISERAGDEFA